MRSDIRMRGLPYGLLVAGGLLVAYALHRDQFAFQMLPGMDGSLTAAVLALVLPVVGGIRYGRALGLAACVVVVQVLSCRAIGVAFHAVLGIELVVFGLVGLVPAVARRSAAEEPRPRRAVRAEPRQGALGAPIADRA